MHLFELLPEARRESVDAALRSVFAAAAVGDARPISGGVSGALIYRIEVRSRPYVLRIEPERIALADRQRGFACMSSAAAAGFAPRVHFADPAMGVAIMDFVASRPLSEHPGGAEGLARALGELVRGVQASEPFPASGAYPVLIAKLLDGLQGSTLAGPGEFERHVEGLESIRAALAWSASSMVPAHNDPNPRNLLFDGERLWLIDWELGFRNDPLVDVAILTTELARPPALQDILLEAAFGRPPDRAQRARLETIRLLTRLFYGCVVLDGLRGTLTSDPRPDLPTFSPSGFAAAVADGRLTSGTPETAYAFARMSLAAFADGVSAPDFDGMLAMAGPD
jgi:thiamine kinase-like enzyme